MRLKNGPPDKQILWIFVFLYAHFHVYFSLAVRFACQRKTENQNTIRDNLTYAWNSKLNVRFISAWISGRVRLRSIRLLRTNNNEIRINNKQYERAATTTRRMECDFWFPAGRRYINVTNNNNTYIIRWTLSGSNGHCRYDESSAGFVIIRIVECIFCECVLLCEQSMR